jgi:hypothetical protein
MNLQLYEEPGENDGVPVAIDDDEITTPIDVDEMEAAARASRLARDPSGPRTLPRRSPRLPYAELRVPGLRRSYVLAAHNPCPTGVALEMPESLALALAEGTSIHVVLRLPARVGDRPLEVVLHARVAHCRPSRGSRPGGIALRWDFRDRGEWAALETALSLRAPTSL